MPTINENFLKLEKNYLFINIAKKVNAFMAENPAAPLIRMGIGDVTLPIAPVCVEAMKKGADEMGVKETFRGYEDSGSGYDFLKKAIAGYYEKFGVSLELDEIRVNDGAKSDCGNIVDIFGDDNIVLITDPAYPVYVDSNKMNGRTVIYADSDESNGFAAMPNPEVHADLIYLCSPNNPSGNCFPKKEIEKVIRRFNGIVILDEAYIDFAGQPGFLSELDEYPNLVILQTLSKAWGMAGLRLGLAFAQPLIVDTLSRVKYPYNINVVTQKIVLEQLRKSPDAQIAEIVSERGRVLEGPAKNPVIRKIHPTDANFVLVEVDEPRTIYDRLIGAGIIVRDRSRIKGCEGCLRITIGTPEENDRLLETLKKL